MTENFIKLSGLTQPEVTTNIQELKTVPAQPVTVSTGAGEQPASLPVAVPDERAPSGIGAEGFVFRVEARQHQVEVRLDTRQIQERERVRRIKEALRRSTQG